MSRGRNLDRIETLATKKQYACRNLAVQMEKLQKPASLIISLVVFSGYIRVKFQCLPHVIFMII